MIKTRRLQNFSEYKKQFSLCEELPYWDFSDESTILSDGSLVKGFELKGLKTETLDANAINQVAQDMKAFLNSLQDSFELSLMVKTDSDWRQVLAEHTELSKKNSLTEWVSESRLKLLNEKIEKQELLRSRIYLFVYQRKDSGEGDIGAFQKLAKIFKAPAHFESERRAQFEKRANDLNREALGLMQSLLSFGIKCRPLSKEEMRSLVYECLNPKRKEFLAVPNKNREHETQEFTQEELALAPELSLGSPREELVFSDLVVDLDSFALDGVHTRVITLKNLPEFTHAGLIQRLMVLPFHYVLHTHIQVPVQSKELQSLQIRRRMAHSMSLSHSGRARDLESEAQLNSTEELLSEIINTGQKVFYFQFAILVSDENKEDLELKTRMVLSKIRELNGAEGIKETVAAFPVWKTALPLGTLSMVRPRRIKSENLAHLLPLYGNHEGENTTAICLFQNRAAGLVKYDPFEPSNPNYNVLVTGSSGSGKSFLNNLILLQYMSEKPKVFVIDIGGSYKKLCELMQGEYIEISPPAQGEATKTINPFLLPEGKLTPQKIKFLMALCETIFTDKEGDKLSKLEKSLLEEKILEVFSQKNSDVVMSDFLKCLQKANEPELQKLARMLFPWTGNRPYGLLLDGEGNLSIQSNFVVFDLKSLSAYPDLQSVMILIITDFILGHVEGQKQDQKRMILMDEVWSLLKSEASSDFIEYCVRTLRKSGSGITFITQGLDEIIKSPVGSAILSNTATKFILMQRGDLSQVEKVLKLNEQEVELIASLRQEKGVFSEAFMIANEDRTIIRLYPSCEEYWVATSDASDNDLLAKKQKEFGPCSLQETIARIS